MARIQVPVSAGELVDKVTILEIKSERIADPAKLDNVRRELAGLSAILDPMLTLSMPAKVTSEGRCRRASGIMSGEYSPQSTPCSASTALPPR